MKTIATGATLVCLLVMGNVVAAGVFHVLGPFAVAAENFVVWLVLGGIAVGSALAFIAGAVPMAFKLLRRIRS